MPTAPYPYHLFTFHADSTVIQSNPDAGASGHSDSNLMGAWTSAGDGFTTKLVETAADRTTHKFVSRTELAMSIRDPGAIQLTSRHRDSVSLRRHRKARRHAPSLHLPGRSHPPVIFYPTFTSSPTIGAYLFTAAVIFRQ